MKDADWLEARRNQDRSMTDEDTTTDDRSQHESNDHRFAEGFMSAWHDTIYCIDYQ